MRIFSKLLLFISFTTLYNNLFSQGKNNPNWEIGFGGGIVRYSDENIYFIGDKTISQLPIINITRKINSRIAIDGAFSFGNNDSSIFTNNKAPYFSFDLSARYRYSLKFNNLNPYVFSGISIVDTSIDKGTDPALNFGTGLTYWISDIFGINSQISYKQAFKTNKIRSHSQLKLGVILGLSGKNSKRGSTRCYYDPHLDIFN